MEIFKVLGTPSPNEWPELKKHKNYNPMMPMFKGTGL